MNVHDPTVIQPSSPSRNPCGAGVSDAVADGDGRARRCARLHASEPADHPGQVGKRTSTPGPASGCGAVPGRGQGCHGSSAAQRARCTRLLHTEEHPRAGRHRVGRELEQVPDQPRRPGRRERAEQDRAPRPPAVVSRSQARGPRSWPGDLVRRSRSAARCRRSRSPGSRATSGRPRWCRSRRCLAAGATDRRSTSGSGCTVVVVTPHGGCGTDRQAHPPSSAGSG